MDNVEEVEPIEEEEVDEETVRILEEERKKEEEIDRCYDVVVNVNSIKNLKEGWKLTGHLWAQLKELYARLVAIIGDYKVRDVVFMRQLGVFRLARLS
jgi:hypothetical protein